jgi:putative flippase GtrA
MIRRQLIAFVVIGVLVNASLYAVYLLLTHVVMGSRAAMTITYCAGVLIGFALNRRITFRFEGDNASALLRFVGAYAIGYAVNFAGLWLLVDRFGAPHEIVQGGMVLGIAVTLFLLQKYWIFRARASRHSVRFLRPTP